MGYENLASDDKPGIKELWEFKMIESINGFNFLEITLEANL